MPSSWSSEIAAAESMGIIFSNSSSSRANWAESATVSYSVWFWWLPSAGVFHASPTAVPSPANSHDILLFVLGGCRGEWLSNGSSIWRSELHSLFGCFSVGLGSLMTSLKKRLFEIASPAAFSAVYCFPSQKTTSRERWSVFANGLYTLYCLVDMLYPTNMPGVAL